MKKFEFFRINNPSDEKIKKVIKNGKNVGYNGIVLLTNLSCFEQLSKLIESQESDFELIKGIEINKDQTNKLKQTISSYRSKTDFLCVKGKNEEINRAAIEDGRIDLLYDPTNPNNRGINHVLAKRAKKNSVAIGLNLKKILKKRGYLRSRIIQNQMKNAEIIKKYDSPFIISTFSDNKFQLKRKRELMNLSELIGFNEEDINKSYETIQKIIELNKKHKKNRFIQPGVEVIEDSSTNIEK